MSSAPPRPVLPRQSLVALLAVQVLFGIFPVVGKVAMTGFGPGGVSAARILGAAAFFQVARLVRGEPAVPRAKLPRFALGALLGIAANQLLFLYGLARTSATHAALLVTTVPVFTVALAIALRKEAASPKRIAGIAVALLGAAWLVTGRSSGGTASLVGDLMVLCNAASYSGYLVLSRELLSEVPPLSAVATFFLLAVPMVLPITGLPHPEGATPAAWASLAFVVLGPTITTYFLNLFALRRVSPSVVALFVYVQPAITAVTAAIVLDEEVTARTLAAGALSFAGVWLATKGAERGR